MERVAVLGLGLMGSALARTFAAGRRSPVVWNRSAARCEPFESLDASVAVSVLAAVSASDVVVCACRTTSSLRRCSMTPT
jgi:3-hydroxyisobutyrate dehydrogenase-like beta-hydroxyacid dehydrogenase